MKTSELFETAALPDWVQEEDRAFKDILKRYNFVCRRKPLQKPRRNKSSDYHQVGTTKINLNEYQFGGDIHDTPEDDEILDKNTRIIGLQKTIAKHLFELAKKHETIGILEKRAVGWYFYDVMHRFIYPGDSLAAVEHLVKDRLFINTHSGGEFDIWFAYRVEPKPAPEKTEEKPRQVRVVKGTK